MLGSPIPCGIVLAKKDHVNRISVSVDYIFTHDKTITESRNAHTPLIMWDPSAVTPLPTGNNV